MRNFYCSQCGKHLTTFRKALPSHGTVIDLIDPHECSEEPVDFDLTPLNVPTFNPEKGDKKFVQKLNELTPKKLNTFFENDLKDRRDEIPSSAPPNVLGILKSLQNSIPDKIISPESEE
jgi:hypothetical protein